MTVSARLVTYAGDHMVSTMACLTSSCVPEATVPGRRPDELRRPLSKMAADFGHPAAAEVSRFVGLAWCAMALRCCMQHAPISRAPATMTPSPMPGNASTLLATTDDMVSSNSTGATGLPSGKQRPFDTPTSAGMATCATSGWTRKDHRVLQDAVIASTPLW